LRALVRIDLLRAYRRSFHNFFDSYLFAFFKTNLGSVFDLAGGALNLGFGITAAIAAVSIPLCLFLFYASILKATAETEADDKEFLKGKY
jgi:hypothetical protein